MGAKVVCGLDEVGRGALAGPMWAAAVILPVGFTHPLLRDSKQLTPKQRETAAEAIYQGADLIRCAFIEAPIIDRIGIQAANRMIFEGLINGIEADEFLVDGTLRLETHKSYQSIIRGDSLYPCIAAASIIAKVRRDHQMIELSEQCPEYQWAGNKGYGSAAHMDAIRRLGPHPQHRRSFIKSIAPPSVISSEV